MNDKDKTKEQLINELNEIRRQITELEKSRTELKRAEGALRENEERFRIITENALAWIWEVDANGKYTYASPLVEKILGYKPEEVLKKHFYDLFHPEEREELKKAAFDVFLKKQSFREFINKNVHKNGKIVWLSTSGSPILNSKGNLIGYRGADIDITERKRAEEALRESEEQYRTLQSNIPVGVFRTTADPSGRLLSANPALVKMFRYETPEEMSKMHVSDLYLNQDDRKKFIEILSSTVEISHYEVQFERKDGTVFWGSLSARAVEDESGKIAYFDGILEDITKKKKAEQALQESEEKYRRVVDNSLVGLYITQSHILKFCNQRLVEMFGFTSSKELIGKHIRELVAPESWELVDKQVKLRESGEGGSIQYEFKGVKKDGTIFDIETSGSRIIYEGNPAIQGSMIDITARKRTEEELRKFATTDVLTGVLNRGHALLLFGKQLQISRRNKQKLSICYVDVDRLKDINDTYGHQEGDEALKLISKFLKETPREADIVCRLGGDEFLMILPQCPIDQAKFVWERIANKLTAFNAKMIKPYIISLSCGFAEYNPDDEKSVDKLIAIADQEMYKDKHQKTQN
ncbi:PAS domain S-box protein [candidate division WOR-3 bacterium]|nr:PAS domain S-box protein [candidate division WOR-3 bacterium]